MTKLSKTPLYLASLAGLLLFAGSASALPIWEENFDGFTAGSDYFQGDPRYNFGFNAAGSKPLSSEEWGKVGGASTPFGFNDIGGGNIATQPNNIGITGMKGSGVFLASSLFTGGTGTYQLQYDLIADSAGQNRNARIWIGTSSTHDQTAVNGWTMVLDAINPSSEPPQSPWELTGATSVETTYSSNLDTSANVTSTLSFNYTAGEDVAIVLGTTNTDASFDNFSISVIPEPSSFALLAGLLGACAVISRRR